MKKQQQDIDKSRRDLLKGLGTAAVAGAVGATVSQSVSAQEPSFNVPTTKIEGYHETQHIRDYYDTL